jgi:hypothetical protein
MTSESEKWVRKEKQRDTTNSISLSLLVISFRAEAEEAKACSSIAATTFPSCV